MGIKDLFKKFTKTGDEINKQLDSHSNILSKEGRDLDKITSIIDSVKNDLTNGKSEKVGIIELSTKLDIATNNKKNTARKKIDISSIVNNPNKLSLANNMMLLEKERISRYDEYEMISKIIPQLNESVRTYVDNILSPDDFTKMSLEKEYSAENISKEAKVNLFDRLDDLLSEYEIEDLVNKNVTKAIILGDSFTVVKKMSEELSRVYNNKDLNLIHENVDKYINTSTLFSENLDLFLDHDNNLILDEEIKEINNKLVKKSKNKNEGKISKDDYITVVNNLIDSNVTVTDDSDVLFSEIKSMDNETKKRNSKIEKIIKSSPLYSKAKHGGKKSKKVEEFKDINGSVVKMLDPRNVIKIESDDYCYGYYYIDTYGTERPASASIQNTISKSGYLQGDANSMILTSLYGTNQNKMEKKRFMYEIFAQKLIDNIDDKFIKKNKQFKSIILNVLDQHNILTSGRNMRIVFIKPQDMIHYKTGGDVYGVSIFEPILFLAKIYLSVLISNLMLKITRGTDKRLFYVEIGVENDDEDEVQAVIRDITQREVALNDLLDLDYIMNIQGANDDYVMPMYDGEKPIEFDMIEKQDIDIDNDFLDFLHKKIQAGVGIPASYIESIEDVQLATTLTMIHEKFMRRVITCQKYYQPANNKLIQKLYVNEYNNINKKNIKQLKKNNNDEHVLDELGGVIVDLIHLNFPSPSTLNFNNMTEQLNRAEEIINKILDIMVPIEENGAYNDDGDGDKSESKKELRNKFRLELYKKYVSNVKWDEHEALLKNLETSSAISTIENKPADDAEADGGDLDDPGSDDPDSGSGDFNF